MNGSRWKIALRKSNADSVNDGGDRRPVPVIKAFNHPVYGVPAGTYEQSDPHDQREPFDLEAVRGPPARVRMLGFYSKPKVLSTHFSEMQDSVTFDLTSAYDAKNLRRVTHEPRTVGMPFEVQILGGRFHLLYVSDWRACKLLNLNGGGGGSRTRVRNRCQPGAFMLCHVPHVFASGTQNGQDAPKASPMIL